jgi:Family of unknown function (DUF6176)
VLRLSFYRIRDEQVDELRRGMQEIDQRQEELLATFAGETMSQEAVFLLPPREGFVLICVTEAEDTDVADREFAASQAPIDLQYKRVLDVAISGEAEVETLLECPDGRRLSGSRESVVSPPSGDSSHGNALPDDNPTWKADDLRS